MTEGFLLDPVVYPKCSMLAVEFVGGPNCGDRAGLPPGTQRWCIPRRTLLDLGVATISTPGHPPMTGPTALVSLAGRYLYGGGAVLMLVNNSSQPLRLSAIWARFEQHSEPTYFRWDGGIGA